MSRPDIKLPGRGSAYLLIVGVIIGMLASGLAIPFIFGKPLSSSGPLAVNSFGTPGSTAPVAGGPAATTPASNPSSSGSPGVPTGATSPSGTAPANTGGLDLGAPGQSLPPGSPPLTASDRGVTATSVTIAFMLADLGGVSKLGFAAPGFDPKTQQADDALFVNYVNAHGGWFGRKIVPLYFKYDPLNQSSEDAACLAATQDNKIFAAIDSGGGMSFQSQLCFTTQTHTPLLAIGSFGTPTDVYTQALGNLFTIEASGIRALGNAAYLLASQGVLKGRKIGILDRDFPGTVQTVKDGMVAVLKQLGYTVLERYDESMDDGTASSQTPVAVQQMQAHGVDTVMLLTDFITGTEFVQAADKGGFHPLYVTSDFESETNDTSVQAVPASFQAIGVTASRVGEWRENLPEPAVDAGCRTIYTAATGSHPARGDNAYAEMLVSCGVVDIMSRGARGAGPNLTRAGYVAALQQIGSVGYPYFGGFSYRPGKRDGTDPVRLIVYQRSCSCWMPRGDFVPPKF